MNVQPVAAPPTSSSSSSARPRSPPRTTLSAPKRRLAPGLEERLKRLGQRKDDAHEDRRQQQIIGRIPDEQIQEIERLQRQQKEKEIARRGKIWTGPPATAMPSSGGVRLSGGPVLTDNEAMFESDVSSVIDISDHFAASETDEDHDPLEDNHKYRLPHVGKTRLNILTKEPLSPAERLPRPGSSSPTTPRTAQSATTSYSPPKMDFPLNWNNVSAENVNDFAAVRPGLSRSGSIYTLGRASFTGQLSQLTSMRLPDPTSLSRRISSIPTSTDAAKALMDAHEQIRMWISKASEVLNGLNAEDDVEWAAAGGREGIADVNNAINQFERLVDVYVSSIEHLQKRADIGSLPGQDLVKVAKQMETIVTSWQLIKDTLQSIKDQVEIAMDWEELWNTVLGEAGQEMDSLNNLVFEMEEKRHQGAESLLSSKESMNLEELETIIEEQPGRSNRLSRMNLMPQSPSQSQLQPAQDSKEGATLLALFARMEPLRASLDFLPMRLSAWSVRGKDIFPTACMDLENRRDQLEQAWEKLSADADSLRRELGEDKWIQLFRNAGRKALKIYESISRSYEKLKEGIDAGEMQSNFPLLLKKIENYEAKKLHYSPAIERVLAIIDKGVLDRLTVNGEILRLQSELRNRWTTLQKSMQELDQVVEEVNAEARERQLRESVSTVVSSERSMGSSQIDTPGSSPASSTFGGSRENSVHGSKTPTAVFNIKTRASNSNLSASTASRRSLPRLSPGANLSASPSRSSSRTQPVNWPSRPDHTPGQRPPWKMAGKATATQNYRPLAAYEPSPYAKPPVTPKSFLRSTSHPASMPPQVPAIRTSNHDNTPPKSSIPRPTPSSLPSRATSQPLSTPTPTRTTARAISSQLTGNSHSTIAAKSSSNSLRPGSRLSSASGKRSSQLPSVPTDGNEADSESPAHQRRPPSVLGGRKASGAASSFASRLGDHPTISETSKPKWRP